MRSPQGLLALTRLVFLSERSQRSRKTSTHTSECQSWAYTTQAVTSVIRISLFVQQKPLKLFTFICKCNETTDWPPSKEPLFTLKKLQGTPLTPPLGRHFHSCCFPAGACVCAAFAHHPLPHVLPPQVSCIPAAGLTSMQVISIWVVPPLCSPRSQRSCNCPEKPCAHCGGSNMWNNI